MSERPVVYTIGYERRDARTFPTELHAAGVQLVVDVRANPWSMRPEFRKTVLEEALREAGVGYRHVGQMGFPRALRDTATSYPEAWEMYRRHVRAQAAAAHALAAELAKGGRCLLCYERDPQSCHRLVLVDELVQLCHLQVEVVHL